MLGRFQSALVGAVCLTATAAMAQTAAPAGVEKQAFDFVRSYAASTVKIDQIPRWRDPICVQVLGLPAAEAAKFKARIEDVAKAVGVPAAPAGCSANVEIAFTAQPQRLVDNFIKGKEWVLGYSYLDPKAKTVTRPVQAWYVTATAGGAGPTAGTAFAYLPNNVGGGGLATQTRDLVLDRPDVLSPTGCGDSTFTSCLQSVTENVFVVVDTARAGDKDVGVLSDYVSMLVLSQPRSLDACQALPSITDLFVSGCAGGAPDGLTPTDAAYLTALYQANPEARKVNEQSDIAGRMAKILAPAGVAAR